MTACAIGAVEDDAVADLLRIGTDDIRSSESRRQRLACFVFTDDRLGKILVDVVKDFL